MAGLEDLANIATRQLGPLPVWAWGIAGGAAFLIFPRFLGGGGGLTEEEQQVVAAQLGGGLVYKTDPEIERQLRVAEEAKQEAEQQIEEIEEQLADLERAKRDADDAARAQIEAQQADLRRQRDQYEARIAASAQRERELRDQIAEERRRFNQQKAELERQVKSLRDQRADLTRRLTASAQAAARNERERNQARQERDLARRQLEEERRRNAARQPAPSQPTPQPSANYPGVNGPNCNPLTYTFRNRPSINQVPDFPNDATEFAQRKRLGLAMFGLGVILGQGGYTMTESGYAKANQTRVANGLRALTREQMISMYTEGSQLLQTGRLRDKSAQIEQLWSKWNRPFQCSRPYGGAIHPPMRRRG